MKFSGKISLINIMILSKFQVDCITLSNFGNFLNIGKYEIFAKSYTKIVYKKCGQTTKNDSFSKILFELFFRHKMASKKRQIPCFWIIWYINVYFAHTTVWVFLAFCYDCRYVVIWSKLYSYLKAYNCRIYYNINSDNLKVNRGLPVFYSFIFGINSIWIGNSSGRNDRKCNLLL